MQNKHAWQGLSIGSRMLCLTFNPLLIFFNLWLFFNLLSRLNAFRLLIWSLVLGMDTRAITHRICDTSRSLENCNDPSVHPTTFLPMNAACSMKMHKKCLSLDCKQKHSIFHNQKLWFAPWLLLCWSTWLLTKYIHFINIHAAHSNPKPHKLNQKSRLKNFP